MLKWEQGIFPLEEAKGYGKANNTRTGGIYRL